MNLIYRPLPARDGINPITRIVVDETFLVSHVTAKKAALVAEMATANDAIAAACAAAERAELEFPGSGTDHTGPIERLRVQITDLEGRIEHYAQALAIFDPA